MRDSHIAICFGANFAHAWTIMKQIWTVRHSACRLPNYRPVRFMMMIAWGGNARPAGQRGHRNCSKLWGTLSLEALPDFESIPNQSMGRGNCSESKSQNQNKWFWFRGNDSGHRRGENDFDSNPGKMILILAESKVRQNQNPQNQNQILRIKLDSKSARPPSKSKSSESESEFWESN